MTRHMMGDVGARIAIKPTWTVTTDGLRHLVVSKLPTSDGTLVKAMCRRWLIPAPPTGDRPDCPDCSDHSAL